MAIQESFADLEGFIANLMQETKIPGLSVMVLKKDEIIYARGFGARSLEGNLPATENTLFGIGSITKSFTCLVIQILQEQGKLNIDDPIKKYLPVTIDAKEEPIRIKHLMSHSSGLPDLGMASVLICRHSVPTKEKMIPFSSDEDVYLHINNAAQELFSPPDKRFFYFNSGFLLLGKIIEKVTNQDLGPVFKEMILQRLKMNRTTFEKEDFEKDNDHMTAYYLTPEGKLKPTNHPFDKFIYAAGGLLSSVKELGNYLQLYLNEGTFGGENVLSKAKIAQLYEPYIERPLESFFGKESYGFGWAITENFFRERLISHGGSTGVSSGYLAFLPEKKLACAVLGNVGNCQGGLVAQLFLAALLGKEALKEHPMLQYETKIGPLLGEYQTYKGINQLKVFKEGLTLKIKFQEEGQPPLTLVPERLTEEEYAFWTPQGPLKFPINFFRDQKTGKVDLIIERSVYHKK